MDKQFQGAKSLRSTRSRSSLPGTQSGVTGLPLAVYLCELILAYGWFLYGIDTLVSAHDDNLIRAWTAAAVDIEIGLVLALSGCLWMWHTQSVVTLAVAWLACGSLVGAIGLSLTSASRDATLLPYFDSAVTFHAGLSFDLISAVLALCLLAANLRAVTAASRYGHVPFRR